MRKRFHGLKRLKIRQSWNKFNLYNISRAEAPSTSQRTYFQQKWTAKALTRAYHGETIREKHWQNMFRSSINSVVPLNHEDLAREDGARHAMGRGSGLEPPPEKRPKPFPKTPYMNMVYAPIERRLDTAIFRALFASSTRQARQFVVHGYVKMIYPGYQLNPGDMFSVEPDRVLYATGATKDARERRNSRRFRAALKKSKSLPTDAEPSLEPAETSPSAPEEASTPDLPTSDPKETLKTLVARAKTLLSNPPTALPAKRKQDIRAFLKLVKQNLSRPTILSDSLEAQFLELTSRLTNPSSSSSSSPDSPPSPETPAPAAEPPAALSAVDRILLRNALAEARENPIDASKPYATPWRPRPYMSAFAFVPRYLEVHHRICSAVYVRHPVARPGLAEVPTPYGSETNSLAYLWYLRRR